MQAISEKVWKYGLIVAIHLGVILAWHLFVTLGDVPSYVMPLPSDTILSLTEEYNWLHNTWITTQEIFGGYLLAVVVGVGLALIFSWSTILNSTVMPLVISLNMIPKVALGPLFIVWMSYGVVPNIIIAFSISFLPILDRKSTRLNSSHTDISRMPSSA